MLLKGRPLTCCFCNTKTLNLGAMEFGLFLKTPMSGPQENQPKAGQLLTRELESGHVTTMC